MRKFAFLLVVAVAAGRALAGGEVPLSANPNGDVKFAAAPKVEKTGDGGRWKISFAASASTDVEAAIMDGDGKIVRHLAAGLLGNNAPPPFKADSLSQELIWDGRDDAGKDAAAGGLKARVRLGVQPRLERYLGGSPLYWDNQIRGLAVSPAGEVYVLAVMGSGYAGTRAFVRVLDGQGQYRRTIVPYPASVPAERTESVGHVIVDGRRLPLVCNAYSGTLGPMLTGMPRQAIAWHPRGHLLLAGAVGAMDDVGPPRHLLAINSQGGAPAGIGFVGPQIAPPLGHGGGAGNGSLHFDSVAVSPDGQWVFYTGYKEGDKKPRHAVLRGAWKDGELAVFAGRPGEAGDDDQHLSNPQGLTTDAAGNVYVCDHGNNRLVVLSPEGKRLATTAVDMPQQVAVHPRSGEIYVASRKPFEKPPALAEATVRRFSALGKEPPKQVWSQPVPGLEIMAVDPTAAPARFWLAVSEKGRGMSLVAAIEKDGKLECGPSISGARDLVSAGIISGGRDANEAFVSVGAPLRIDLTTGATSPLALKGNVRPSGEFLVGQDGNLYVQSGGGGGLDLYRFDARGEPLPFEATGLHKLKLDRPTKSLRGFCVTRDGTIYVLGWEYRVQTYLDSYDAKGKPARRNIIDGLASGATGVQVDAAGNIYVTENLKQPEAVFPEPFATRVPPLAWKWFTAKDKRPVPWCYTQDNAYMSFWGCVMKFPPAGGTIYGLGRDGKPLKEAPADAIAFKTGYLAGDVKVSGALWVRPCVTYAGSHDFGTDGANCMCISSRTALDEFGRLYVPDPFRFCVTVLDGGGNVIRRIGSYGNIDSAGQSSAVPEPEIAFAWPRYVACMKDQMIVSDAVNRRLVVVGLRAAAEETCPVP